MKKSSFVAEVPFKLVPWVEKQKFEVFKKVFNCIVPVNVGPCSLLSPKP